jgi:fructokinase
MSVFFCGMEANGTKFACAIGTNPKDLRDNIRFDTTTPDETINRAIEYLQAQNSKERLK